MEDKLKPIIGRLGEWQLCPKCNGEGTVVCALPTMSTSPFKVCDVCYGAKIIRKPFELFNEQGKKLISKEDILTCCYEDDSNNGGVRYLSLDRLDELFKV